MYVHHDVFPIPTVYYTYAGELILPMSKTKALLFMCSMLLTVTILPNFGWRKFKSF